MWYVILISLVIDICGLLLVYVLLRDRVRRATTSEAQIAEIREEVSRLLVELNQTTDRNVALMEDRITSLNELLTGADRKIGLLRRETEKHDVGTQVYSRLVEGRPARGAAGLPPAAAAPGAEPGAPQAVPLSPGAAGGIPPGGAAARAEGAAAQAAGAAARPSVARAPLSVELSDRSAEAAEVRERIMMLHKAGFSASLISSRVGAPLGEVELIISLEQRKGLA